MPQNESLEFSARVLLCNSTVTWKFRVPRKVWDRSHTFQCRKVWDRSHTLPCGKVWDQSHTFLYGKVWDRYFFLNFLPFLAILNWFDFCSTKTLRTSPRPSCMESFFYFYFFTSGKRQSKHRVCSAYFFIYLSHAYCSVSEGNWWCDCLMETY